MNEENNHEVHDSIEGNKEGSEQDKGTIESNKGKNSNDGMKDTNEEVSQEFSASKTYGTEVKNIAPFPLTYQRGERHVFAASNRQGAMPSTSKKKLEKGV